MYTVEITKNDVAAYSESENGEIVAGVKIATRIRISGPDGGEKDIKTSRHHSILEPIVMDTANLAAEHIASIQKVAVNENAYFDAGDLSDLAEKVQEAYAEAVIAAAA